MPTRDTIVIGSSAGGVAALPRLLAMLSRDIPAAIAVCQHLSPDRDPYLVEILSKSAAVPVQWADQGVRFDPGRIYVAPANLHLLLEDDHLLLSAGPRENHSRPSIDRLFRSVAAARGPRTIAVLLTGLLDDGVAGLLAIQAMGGTCIVQNPEDADFPDMPRRAIAAMRPDHVARLDEIGHLLARLAGTEVPPRPPSSPRRPSVELEASLDRSGPADPADMDRLGNRSPFICPECDGPLWEVGEESARRYRCYLGHVATARELLRGTGDTLEAALWSAIRALRERASTYGVLADEAAASGQQGAEHSFRSRANETSAHADLAHRFLLDVITPG